MPISFEQDFAAPLSSPPIRLSDRCLTHIAQQASSHLSEMSYNLTTIALHDWKTYERMLRTARTVYGLSFVQTQLPTQTVEQGLDVLSIARSMHSFVQRYAYNLNNQIFVETVSSNKHLNVLFIRHVANSIQTHGHGVLNTAVNLTYQFVRQQLNLLSQFLYEEHLKSRLVRDVRMYKESKGEYFPYERAERLVKGIRKLGITSEGLSLLDQVRILLTQVGNALGFVRMLRSGALHCSSASVHFIPDVDDLPDTSFHNLCVNEGFDGEVLRAADNLDSVLKQLNRNFSTATDYLQLLVTVFGDTLREQKHAHINNLFALVPALSISFVEHAILSKEKMNRKNAAGAAFTDDGFAVGVAYVLSLLHQVHDFQSLHWFRSVRCKIAEERNAVTSDSATDQRFAHTTSLTLKRLSVLQSEFDLLEYNLTCCRILFRS